MSDINNFHILECQGILSRYQLMRILENFPVDFYSVDEYADPRTSYQKEKKDPVEVYHDAGVVSIFPSKGKRLSNAILTDRDFPIKPDNIMDDQLGLRCCYHPQLSAFGIEKIDNWDSIEIDIHKFSKENNYRWKVDFS